ncbi:MAG TPA: multidrug efflux SMR transporter [Candidatus Acidoferrales bacterium]
MPQIPWVYLVIAGVFEVVWAVLLKSTQGFTRLWPSLWTIAAMLVSFYFLALAVRTLPVGTAYAVWVGIGAAGTAVLGMILLGEPRDALRMACIALIVVGAVGLRVLSPAQ